LFCAVSSEATETMTACALAWVAARPTPTVANEISKVTGLIIPAISP
jgi:hypothetical protein